MTREQYNKIKEDMSFGDFTDLIMMGLEDIQKIITIGAMPIKENETTIKLDGNDIRERYRKG